MVDIDDTSRKETLPPVLGALSDILRRVRVEEELDKSGFISRREYVLPEAVRSPGGLELPRIEIAETATDLMEFGELILVGSKPWPTVSDGQYLQAAYLGPVVPTGRLEVVNGSYQYNGAGEGFRDYWATFDIHQSIPGVQHEFEGLVRPHGLVRPGEDVCLDVLNVPKALFPRLSQLYGPTGRLRDTRSHPDDNRHLFPELGGKDSFGLMNNWTERLNGGGYYVFGAPLVGLYGKRS